MTVGLGMDAGQLSARVQALSAAHPWMDPQTNLALAASPVDDTQMIQAGSVMQQALIQNWDGYAHVYNDPVLTKQPTQALTARAAIEQTAGHYPVNEDDLTEIQGNLQRQGFGQGLPQGVWDPAWNQALYQYTRQQANEKFAGQNPTHGEVSAHSVLHGLWKDLSPKGAFDAIIGFAKSLPGDVRSLVADEAAGYATAVSGAGSVLGALRLTLDVLTPGAPLFQQAIGLNQKMAEKGILGGASAGNRVGAAVESFGRAKGPLSQQDYVQRLGLGRAFDDVTTVLTLVPGLGEASDAAKALRFGVRGITDAADTTAAAARSGGLIANSLRPTLEADRTPGLLARALYKGTKADPQGGLFGSQWALNNPILARTGPLVSRTWADDGWYYKARTKAAYLYRVPAVRVAGNVYGRALVAGAGLSAAAQAQQALSPSAESAQIAGENAVPSWVNWTALLLHPTPGDELSPGTAAKTAWQRLAALKASDPPGAKLAMDDTLRLAHQNLGQDTKDWADLTRRLPGGEAEADMFLRLKLADQAAASLAERRLALREDPRFAATVDESYSQDRHQALQTLAHEAAWQNPQQHAIEARALAADTGHLTARLYKQIADEFVKPGEDVSHGIHNYMTAGGAVRDILAADKGAHLITPATLATTKQVRDDMFADYGMGLGPKPPKRLGSDPAWREANLDQPLGALGIARQDTKVRQEMLADADAFEQRLTQTSELPGEQQLEARNKILLDMAAYLHTNAGMDARKLVGLGDPDKMLAAIRAQAQRLAVRVYPARNAPQQVLDKLKVIERAGYKPVFGTDIGHAWSSSLPSLPELGAAASRGRKVARALALSLEGFSDTDLSQIKRANVRVALQKATDAGQIRHPAFYTVDTLLHEIQDKDLLPELKQAPLSQRLALEVGSKLRTNQAARLARLTGQSKTEVLKQMETDLSLGLGLRDVRLSTFHKVLGRTDEDVPWPTDLERGGVKIPLYSPQSVDAAYRAVQKGLASSPTYMVGLSKLDDVARRLGGPLGSVLAHKYPHAAAVVEGLPPRLLNALLRYRFTTSPMFSLRRIVKTNLKMGLEGVDPTWNPLSAMERSGTYEQDAKTLNRVYPELAHPDDPGLDQAIREISQGDAYGLYNARWYEQYFAGQLARAGDSDDEIRRKIIKVFTYGSGGKDARTALERSVNTVFFPFSFERTLYRNVGGYLLDRPVQALAIAAGVQQWRALQTNSAFGKWVDAHLPILADLQTLNAFSTGVGLGQLGGVYAPGLNLFLPQSWSSSKDALRAVTKIMPLYGDLNRQFFGYDFNTGKFLPQGGSLWQQADIAVRAAQNLGEHGLQVAHLMGKPEAWAQHHPAATWESQLDAAYALRTSLYAHYAQQLAWNERASNSAAEWRFPNDPALPVQIRDATITKTNIGWLVHARFPVYDPLAGEVHAQEAVIAVQQWLANVRQRSPQDYRSYSDFVTQSRRAAAYINDGSYTDQQTATEMRAFRAYAAQAAAADPAFRKFYSSYFAWLWGPLSLASEDTG